MLICLTLTALLALGHVSCSESEKRDYDPFHDECGIEAGERLPCGRRHDALGELECVVRGCCFDNSDSVEAGVPRCFLAKRMLAAECDVAYEEKDDCGYYGIREVECLRRGCCWRPSALPNDAECFYKARAPVRLINNGAESEREGRVEIFHDDEWGTVCDDAFDDTDATVVCNQLGFDNGVARCCAEYGYGSGQIWMDQVGCMGDETHLEDCSQNGWGEHDCSHSEDASVICYNDDEPVPAQPTPPPYYYSYYNDYGSGDYRFAGGKGKPKRNNPFKEGFKHGVEKSKRNNSFKEGFKHGVEKSKRNNSFKEGFKHGEEKSKRNNSFKEGFKHGVEKSKRNNSFKEGFKTEKGRLARKLRGMPLLQGLQNILKKKATQ